MSLEIETLGSSSWDKVSCSGPCGGGGGGGGGGRRFSRSISEAFVKVHITRRDTMLQDAVNELAASRRVAHSGCGGSFVMFLEFRLIVELEFRETKFVAT